MYRSTAAFWFKVLGIAAFVVLYCTSIVPWWVSRAGSCAIVRRPMDVIEYIWGVWTSSQCSWTSDQARWVLPAIFIIVPLLFWLLVSLWGDWDNGPPEWSVTLTSFGVGALAAGAIVYASYLILAALTDQFAFAFSETALQVIVSAVVFVSIICLAIWAWVKVYKFISWLFTVRGSPASAPFLYIGSTLGAAVGISIGMTVVAIALFIVLIIVGVYVMLGLLTLAAIGIALKAVG